jgi:hypothetical protein
MTTANRYSTVCSIINLLLVFILTIATSIAVWKTLGILVWWAHVGIIVAGLLVYGYIVQWWLSGLINTLISKLLLHEEDET